MRGGPQVIWGASGVFHRPRRSDRDRAMCGPVVVKPWLGGEATMAGALRLGLRACRQRACGLPEAQHSLLQAVSGAGAQLPDNASEGDSGAA